MFGYIKPLKCELKVKDWEYYRAAYCGLCHALNKRCGFFARFVLNYDFTFLAILLSALEGTGECNDFEFKRCLAHPAKKRCVKVSCDAYYKAADASVILTWWKLHDSITDLTFFRSLTARISIFFLRKAYRHASDRNKLYSDYVKECLNELYETEQARVPMLDLPADSFAKILSKLSYTIENNRLRRPVEQIFYHVGRFIYIIDAWDDLEEDKKSGNYNPIAERFGTYTITDYIKEDLTMTLNNSIQAAQNALDFINIGNLHGLIENIISLGMPAVLNQVSNGMKPKKEKIIHE